MSDNKAKIAQIRINIENLEESVQYADGQAYYNEKDRIRDMYFEISRLESIDRKNK